MKRGLSRVGAAWLLLGIQLALVLSITGKYLYERATRPRVWVRTAQYDPERPLRGRYLALQPVVDVCALPRDKELYGVFSYVGDKGEWDWPEVTLVADGGKLVPRIQADRRPGNIVNIRLRMSAPCERAIAQTQLEYFIPEHAKTPFPLAAGHELWVEVTVPESGPLRPIQLAIAGPDGWKPLRF